MSVYIRTAAGTAAALNPLVKLPRNLRQLLVAIDGSTPTSAHAMRMGSQGDIDVLFEALLRAGLIRQAGPPGARHGDAAAGLPPLTPEFSLPPTPSRALADSAVQSLHAGVASKQAGAEPVAVAALALAPVADDFASFGTETAPAGLSPAGAGYYEVGNVISLMSDFVTQHLPDRSLEIVLALESLSSVDQVLASLHDYRALITPTGEAAHLHLAELQRLLDSA